jgi:uncharacterized protein YbjQ (UPF0145 family)
MGWGRDARACGAGGVIGRELQAEQITEQLRALCVYVCMRACASMGCFRLDPVAT